MAAALVAAQYHPEDQAATSKELANLFKVLEIASHLDLDLRVTCNIHRWKEIEMEVEGPEEDAVVFVGRCKDESVRVKAVREDGETNFRLV